MHFDIPDTILFGLFLIYASAAIMATLALFTRQPLLVIYMILGMILVPYGLKLLPMTGPLIKQTGNIGIIFLLFLLGLQLHPQKLLKMFRETIFATLLSSLIFAIISFVLCYAFSFTLSECIIISAGMMFSSTIVGLKLLPTNDLNNHRVGEIVISVLLLQDIIAIIALMLIYFFSDGKISSVEASLIATALPLLCFISYLIQHFILIKLIKRFEKIHEYIFLLSVGWCISIAVIAQMLGLSGEIGAFIAGVALASNSVSQHISKNLTPLRDFFLVLFFFAIGAQFDYHTLPNIIAPAIILAMIMLIAKPLIFRLILSRLSPNKSVIWEASMRLGQISEFALLIIYLAQQEKLISNNASYVVQAAVIITFIISSYNIILRYPTPMNFSNQAHKN